MNIIRTVPRHETLRWVDLLFQSVADTTDDRAHFDWIVHAPSGGTVKLIARH